MIPHFSIEKSFERFMPKAPDPVVVASAEEPTPVTSKMDMGSANVCPYCHKPMVITQCCDQPMYVCNEDRAVFPIEDPAE